MPTINDKGMVDRLIAQNGRYRNDTQLLRIVQYTNMWGGTAYGLIYQGQSLSLYEESEYVRNPVVLWDYEGD